jgi:AcrR family transcriptional regulator
MTATPTTRKGLETHRKVLEAASRVFARDGYVDARMLDIAVEAGVSTGGLYRYFDNKIDVFTSVIADIHEEFFQLSGRTRHLLATNPLAALTEANRGYIEHYYKHRDVMRVFIEAASIEERFRVILRNMRDRHVRRFASAYRMYYGENDVHGIPVDVATEAMACMTEQCCYVWFAQERDCNSPTSIEQAITVTSQAWYATMFADRPAVAL